MIFPTFKEWKRFNKTELELGFETKRRGKENFQSFCQRIYLRDKKYFLKEGGDEQSSEAVLNIL